MIYYVGLTNFEGDISQASQALKGDISCKLMIYYAGLTNFEGDVSCKPVMYHANQ